MCQRTVIVFVLALVTIGSAAPQYSGDEFLEDKRLYLKGSDKKKAIWKSANDKTLWTWFQPAPRFEQWPTQKPWADNYWQERLKLAEERVQAATRIAARSRGIPERNMAVVIVPQKPVSIQFDFPVGSRSRRAKRDLMDVTAGAPLNAIYKDNVISEFEPYGSAEKKKDSTMAEGKPDSTELPGIMDMMDMGKINTTTNNVSVSNRTDEKPSESVAVKNMEKVNLTTTETTKEVKLEGTTTVSSPVTDPSEMSTTEEGTTVSATNEPPTTTETKISTSKGFKLCSEDGLSCSRPISIQQLQESDFVKNPRSTEGTNEASTSTTDDPKSAIDVSKDNIEKIPFKGALEVKPSVPVVILRPVDATKPSVTTVVAEANDTMADQGRSFENSPGMELNQIPVEANQGETSTVPESNSNDPVTKLPESTTAPDTTSTITPSTVSGPTKSTEASTKSSGNSNQENDESIIDKMSNWFENAWISIKSIF